MGRATVIAVVSVVLVMLMVTPVSAERPFTFSDSVTFTDVNPCDGLDMEVTINFVVSIHEHPNNFVVVVDRSGTIDSGFTMIAGAESFVENRNVVRGAFVDQWRHPDGSKFRVRGNFIFNVNQLELLVDNFSLLCIGDN